MAKMVTATLCLLGASTFLQCVDTGWMTKVMTIFVSLILGNSGRRGRVEERKSFQKRGRKKRGGQGGGGGGGMTFFKVQMLFMNKKVEIELISIGLYMI